MHRSRNAQVSQCRVLCLAALSIHPQNYSQFLGDWCALSSPLVLKCHMQIGSAGLLSQLDLCVSVPQKLGAP
jgi:hypothetical protein